MNPRLVAGAGLLTLVLVMSACGSKPSTSSATPPTAGASTSSAAPSPTPGASASPPTTPSGADLATACARKPLHLRGAVEARFGNADVTTAYCSMVAFSFEQGTTNLATARAHHTAAEFAFVRPYLTRSARRYWDSEVHHAIAHEGVTQWQNVAALSLVDLTAFGRFTPPPSGTVCVRPSFTPPRAGVLQRGESSELRLQFTMSCDLVLVKTNDPAGARYHTRFVNDREFILTGTDTASRPWLIDGWVGHFRFTAGPTPGQP